MNIFKNHYFFLSNRRAWILSSVTTNFAAEFPAFGVIAGVSTSGMRLISLTLGKLLS